MLYNSFEDSAIFLFIGFNIVMPPINSTIALAIDELAPYIPSCLSGVIASVASGLAAGGVGGAVAGGLGYMALGSKGGGALKRLGRGAAAGLAAGALLGTGIGYMKKSAEDSRNQFYNDRLRYAKRMARRREAKNWKHNMAHRENYSF